MGKTYYPILLDLTGRRALVVGGGRVAQRKARGLAAAGARVRVVAPQICAGLRHLKGVEVRQARYSAAALRGASLVISATDSAELNARVAADCRRRGIWCNVVDAPRECAFILPAVVRRGPLVLAVSTGGASPTAALGIAKRLGREFGPEYATWLAALAAARALVRSRVASEPKRRKILARLARPDVLRAARRGRGALNLKVAGILRACGLVHGAGGKR